MSGMGEITGEWTIRGREWAVHLMIIKIRKGRISLIVLQALDIVPASELRECQVSQDMVKGRPDDKSDRAGRPRSWDG